MDIAQKHVLLKLFETGIKQLMGGDCQRSNVPVTTKT